MPIPFACPHCGTKTLVDDQYAGLQGACVSCAKQITVPFLVAARTGPQNAVATPGPTRSASAGWTVLVVAGCLLGCVAALLLIFALAFPAIRAARAAALRDQTQDNLAKLVQAMNQYRSDHGSYPPAFLPDANGVPMHSWRVLLLRYLDAGLYEDYNFDLPWDQQDQRFRMRMPDVFAAAGDEGALEAGNTSYFLVVGNETAFPKGKATTDASFQDGPSETIMIVECHGSQTEWLKPSDLQFDRMRLVINGGVGEINSSDPRGAFVVTADGVTHFLHVDAPPEQVRALITASGNDVVDWRQVED